MVQWQDSRQAQSPASVPTSEEGALGEIPHWQYLKTCPGGKPRASTPKEPAALSPISGPPCLGLLGSVPRPSRARTAQAQLQEETSGEQDKGV